MKNPLIFLLFLFGLQGVAVADATEIQLEQLRQQFSSLESRQVTQEAALRVEDGKLQNQIEANRNSVISLSLPYIVTLAVGFIVYLLGDRRQKGIIAELTASRVDNQLEKIVPGICDQKVWDYFKKKFPGDLPCLELAAKIISYDAELRQTKQIVVVGLENSHSKPLIKQLRENGFLSVEFRQLSKEFQFNTNSFFLVDRYSHEGTDNEIDDAPIGGFLRAAKKLIDQGQIIHTHIYGKYQVEKGETFVTQHNGFTQIPSKLIPNIMDQLRYAFPKSYNSK